MKDTKLITVLVLFAMSSIFIAYFRPASTQKGIPSDYFWVSKIDAGKEFDIVIFGDSRVYRGVSPKHMESILQDKKILYFGFSNVGLTSDYLKDGIRKLKTDAENRLIVIGITSHSMTPNAFKHNNYTVLKETKIKFSQMAVWLNWLLGYFRPLAQTEIMEMFGALPPSKAAEEYHWGGWVSLRTPAGKSDFSSKYYVQDFANNKVTDENIRETLNAVREIVSGGVAVYGFRPPVSRELQEFEQQYSGLQYTDLVRQFEEAGGIWIPIEPDKFSTYDHSHLSEESAIQLSQLLAEQIRISSWQ
ncbi:MAG: hypothetical protein HY537_10810 [Deltaproteobacteria bacterium]|nr:hypothetical protein [Deltaproteobacteria bacterium]